MSAGATEYDNLIAVLERIDSALAEQDLDRVGVELEKLTDIVTSLRMKERPLVARLQAAQREQDLGPDDHEFIATFQEKIATAYLHRSGLLLGGDLLRFDPVQGEPAELRTAIGQIVENEKSIRDVMPKAESISSDVTLPPRIGILRFSVDPKPVPFGAELSAELTVQNVGDESTTDVTAIVQSKNLDRSESRTIDELEPDESVSLTFAFEAVEAGTLGFEATVSSETAGQAKDSTEVTSVTKRGFVEEALETIAELRKRTTETVDHDGTARSITSKLDAVSKSLDRALGEIDDGRDKQANNAISTAINQLGAVLNTIDGGRGRADRIPDQFETVLRQYIEGTIESLAEARDVKSAT